MKKIDLLDNETFTIKGAYGEVYVFDGQELFVDPVGLLGSKKATVIKSLRTEKGAQDWVKLAGSKFENAEILDTDSLKANFDDIEGLDMDESLPFHVVVADDDDDGEDEEMDLDEVQEDMSEEMEEAAEEEGEDDFEDGAMARTQLSQILEDARELYSMIESAAELEAWVQSKLTRAADYMNAISEYLTHDEEAQDMLEGDEDEEETGESQLEEMVEEQVEEEMSEESESDEDEDETQKGKVKEHIYKPAQIEEEKFRRSQEEDITREDMESAEIDESKEKDTKKSEGGNSEFLSTLTFEKGSEHDFEYNGKPRKGHTLIASNETHAKYATPDGGIKTFKKEHMVPMSQEKSVPADPAMMSASEDETHKAEGKKPDADGDGVPDWADKNPTEAGDPEDERKSVAGKVFKSLHAARQWNKFENPDKDRFYIDIMRSADFNNPWDRTRNMNAKYVVRDMHDTPTVTKGAYGNRKVARSMNLPEKSIDAGTREAAALTEPQAVPEDSVGE